ncbi:MAG: hypothetical protein MI919_38175, partial [Holophagales bacterium]|nr:hypothetical protein [Holophagales bacterium]
GFSVGFALMAVAPESLGVDHQPITLSVALVGFASAGFVDPGIVGPAVHIAWIVHGSTCVALFLISVGQLWMEERREARRLRRWALAPSDARVSLQAAADRLTAEVGCGRVRIAVSDSPSPIPSARRIGWWRPLRFVEIPAVLVERSGLELATALLSHELAHHHLGHCRRYQLFRWLGRLSFVGDGFVLAFQRSWSYEEEADGAAAEAFGTGGRTMSRALRSLRSLAQIQALESRRTLPGARAGIPATGAIATGAIEALSDEGSRERSTRETWAQAWRLFLIQYFRAAELHYWYPPSRERLEALEAISGDAPSPTGPEPIHSALQTSASSTQVSPAQVSSTEARTPEREGSDTRLSP